MADEKLNVGINFNVTGNADAAAALGALGTAAAETAAEFDAAAVSAKAMADAVTGAQALSSLGIRASAPGVVNAEGSGLVTVAAEEQANAQNILNQLGLEATAVTSEQAAATLRLAAAATEAAVAETRQAEATAAATSSSWAAGMEQISASFAGHRSMVAGMTAINEDFARAQRGVAEGEVAMEREATGATSAFGGLWTQLIAVVAALEAYNKAKEFIDTGIAFNSSIESARLGIAASLVAMADMTNAQGKALEGQEKFGAATAVADDQIQKLFADSARTSTTVQQLVTTYQGLIGAGLAAGATLDQIRQLTTDAALAAGAMNVPYSQLNVTLVQLLNGHSQMRNRLTADLHITSAMVKDWKEHNTLVEHLIEKFGQFEALGTRVQGTWRGIMSNVKEFAQQFTGAATAGAFTTLETGIKGQLGRVFDFDTGKLTSNVAGAANLMREGLGGAAQLVVDIVGKIVNGLEEMGTWFENNRAKAEEMGRAFVELVKNTGQILLDIAKIFGEMVTWAAESVAVQTSLRTIADILGFISGPLGAIVAGVTALVLVLSNAAAIGGAVTGIVAFLAALNPVTLTIGLVVAAVGALTAVVEHHNITQERAAAALEATRQRTVEHATSTAALVLQYQALAKEIASGKLKDDDLSLAKARLKSVTDELIKLSPAYKDALSSEEVSLGEKLAAVEKLHAAEIAELETKRNSAFASEIALNAQVEAQKAHVAEIQHTRGFLEVENAKSDLADLQSQLAASRAAFAGAEGALEASKKKATPLPNVKGKPEPGADKGEKGLAAAEASAAIERMKAEAATITRELDGQLARNEISYAQYFDRLNAIELSALDVQIAAKQKLLGGTKDPKEKIKLGADIEALQEQETQTVEKNAAKRLQMEQQYEKQRTTIAVEAMKDRGQTELAFEVEFDEKYRAEMARALAEGDAATLANIAYLHDARAAKNRADVAATEARGVTSESEGTIQGTKAGVEDRTISEVRGRELIIAAYERERAAILAALAAAEALAKISPTPDNIAKVDALSKQYQTVQKSIVQASDTSLHLRQQLAGALSSDLTEFFTKTVEGAHSVGEAFRSLAASVIQSIQQIVSQLLAAQVVKGIMSLLGGGGGLGGAALSAISNAGVAHAASGGHVTGAGGPTSDSIPAMLSAGEYVVRASAVDSMGVGFFDAVNAGSMRMRPHAGGGIARYAEGGVVRAFASGGAVGSNPGSGPEQQGAGSSHHLHVSIDPGLIVETMRSPAGHKVTMETLQRNPKAARQSMRIP